MKKQLNEKLSKKATKVLVGDLDDKALEAVTGGTLVAPAPCRPCGIPVPTVG